MEDKKRFTVVFYFEEVEAYQKWKRQGFSMTGLKTKDKVALYSFDRRIQNAVRGVKFTTPTDVRKYTLEKEAEAERSHGTCVICGKANQELYAGACQPCFREWVKSSLH